MMFYLTTNVIFCFNVEKIFMDLERDKQKINYLIK